MGSRTLDGITALVISRGVNSRQKEITALTNAGYRVVQTTSHPKDITEAGLACIPQLVCLDLADNTPTEIRFLLKALFEESAFSHSSIVLLSSRKKPPQILCCGEAGIVHVISIFESMPIFIERIRTVLRIRPCPTYRFTDPSPQNIKIQLNARIVGTNETGFVMKAPVKIANLAVLQVHAASFEDLGLNSCLFRRTACEASLVSGQDFYNEISVIGISPSSADQLSARASRIL